MRSLLDRPGMQEIARAISLLLVEVDGRLEAQSEELRGIMELVTQELRDELKRQATQIAQLKEECEQAKKDRTALIEIILMLSRDLKGEIDVGEKEGIPTADNGDSA